MMIDLSTNPKMVKLNRLYELYVKAVIPALQTSSYRIVRGEGDINAKLMLVGEAPGETEDQMFRPFVGRSGETLRKIIARNNILASDLYITNVFKNRLITKDGGANRTPSPYEIQIARPYLLHEIAIINPKAILCLGKVSASAVLGEAFSMDELRGRTHDFQMLSEAGEIRIPTFVTYHPAYLIYAPQVVADWERDVSNFLVGEKNFDPAP